MLSRKKIKRSRHDYATFDTTNECTGSESLDL